MITVLQLVLLTLLKMLHIDPLFRSPKLMSSDQGKITVAFDVDGCLITEDGYDRPRHEIIWALMWFHKMGHLVFVWSGGGIPYAQQVVDKLNLTKYCRVVEKGAFKADVAFDDCEADLATVMIRV